MDGWMDGCVFRNSANSVTWTHQEQTPKVAPHLTLCEQGNEMTGT